MRQVERDAAFAQFSQLVRCPGFGGTDFRQGGLVGQHPFDAGEPEHLVHGGGEGLRETVEKRLVLQVGVVVDDLAQTAGEVPVGGVLVHLEEGACILLQLAAFRREGWNQETEKRLLLFVSFREIPAGAGEELD